LNKNSLDNHYERRQEMEIIKLRSNISVTCPNLAEKNAVW